MLPREASLTSVAQTAGTSVSPTLVPCADGWELLAADGSMLLRAHGRAAHSRCVRRAYELGALFLR
jgi:hypothetical protein